MESKPKDAHLFVFVHGLWGGPNHMLVIEQAIKNSLANVSNEQIVTLRPSSFRFWKTYDGLKVNSEKIIREIFYELEILKQRDNLAVTKFSIVGYSLGGLISRYVIGRLNELKFFDLVEPMFFSTFATPHLGVHFFNDNLFDNAANFFGSHLFGKSGREMFLTDTDSILEKISDPEGIFMNGLFRFRRHILLANIKNDRTVAFYTSYITPYSPFQDWNSLRIKFLKHLPEAKIGKVIIKPKFVDLTRTRFLDEEELQVLGYEACFTWTNVLRLLGIMVVATFILPFWIPLVLFGSAFASIYSMIKIRWLALPDNANHWLTIQESIYQGLNKVSEVNAQIGAIERDNRDAQERHESFKGDTSQITANTFENFLYADDQMSGKSIDSDNDHGGSAITENKYDDDNDEDEFNNDGESGQLLPNNSNKSVKSLSTNPIIQINYQLNDETIKNHLDSLKIKDTTKFSIFQSTNKLNFDVKRTKICDNLNNTIDWIKVPVYIDSWNAHDGIVARRGARTNPKGAATIYYWTSIIRDFMLAEQQ